MCCAIVILLIWARIFLKDINRSRHESSLVNRSNTDILRQATRLRIGERVIRDLPDCSVTVRYCAFDTDCDALCKDFRNIRFHCEENKCVARPIVRDNNDDSSDKNIDVINCNLEAGEYALLVGYTNLGVAKWKCVQMYKKFLQRDKFCEGGTFLFNALIKSPSYRDCLCPSDAIRAVYNVSSLYDDALPHCIPRTTWQFYANSMRPV